MEQVWGSWLAWEVIYEARDPMKLAHLMMELTDPNKQKKIDLLRM